MAVNEEWHFLGCYTAWLLVLTRTTWHNIPEDVILCLIILASLGPGAYSACYRNAYQEQKYNVSGE
jgi:hypothetical protein